MRSFKRTLLILAIAIPTLYVLACVLLYLAQRSFLYFPTPAAPDDISSVSIESEGEILRILTRPADSPDAIIVFGGNADDVSAYLGSFAAALPEQNLFLVNYRGYGGSSGAPSESALFADAIAVYDHVKTRFPNVSVFGRSLGSGVAVHLASVREVDKLILVTPYDSIENVAREHFPIFPITLLLMDKFDSASRVKDVNARTLVLIAEDDRTIPRDNTQTLVRKFRSDQVSVKILPGTTHNSIAASAEYLLFVREFLNPSPQ